MNYIKYLTNTVAFAIIYMVVMLGMKKPVDARLSLALFAGFFVIDVIFDRFFSGLKKNGYRPGVRSAWDLFVKSDREAPAPKKEAPSQLQGRAKKNRRKKK